MTIGEDIGIDEALRTPRANVCDNIDICVGLHTTIDNNVYICSNLQVLQDFINENESLNHLSAEDIGVSQWDNNGFLTNLSLPAMQLTSVPQSIGTLDSLETLFLNDNQISVLPESICNLPSSCQIQVQNNCITPPYPDCTSRLGGIGEQNDDCEE